MIEPNSYGTVATVSKSSLNFREKSDSASRKRSYHPFQMLIILSISIASLSYVMFSGDSFTPKLGLDLQGGTSIILQPQTADIKKISADSVAQAISILRQRIDAVGVSESQITAEGSGATTKITISVPGKTRRELVALVGQTAKLSIRPVLFATGALVAGKDISFPDYIDSKSRESFRALDCKSEIASSSDDPTKPLFSCDQGKSTKFILGPSKVEGSQVTSAQFSLDQSLGWITTINFNLVGQAYFGDLTTRIATLPPPRNQIAIVLDGKVVTAPRVDGPLTGGNVSIYGKFTRNYASELSNILKYGALPFSFKVDEVQQISASLGATQLRSGLLSGLLGLILISIYLFFYYRGLGVLAVGSLIIAFIITYELFVDLSRLIGLTLTLSGIAGAIVSIGVIADSFIVYFERVRDEIRMGSALKTALFRGWDRAKRTIWVADTVSLIAAFVLYFGTTGEVKGFAFTLGVTTFIDLFIVYCFTRPFLTLLANLDFFSNGHPLSGLSQASIGTVRNTFKKKRFSFEELGGKLFSGEVSLNIATRPKRWYLFSGALILIAGLSLGIFGLKLGIEFKGGSVNTVTTSTPSISKAQQILKSVGYSDQAVVQIIGRDQVRIETAELSNQMSIELTTALSKGFNVPLDTIDSKSVGPSWGAEISKKALEALLWFVLILCIYLAFVLEFKMAGAALIAVVHDVFITVGFYALVGLKVTPSAVIGFLTILGYSLYDSVVVFDKVRENLKLMVNRTPNEYRRIVNLALNQTLIRSLNTSIVAIIPIGSILLIGSFILKADTLKDISLALVIGQSIGTYSSIFIAAPILATLNRRNFGRNKSHVSLDSSFIPSQLSTKKETLFEFSSENFQMKRLTELDTPVFFKNFYGNENVWKRLWVDSKIPAQIDECKQLIKTKLSQLDKNSNFYFMSNSAGTEIDALLVVDHDSINSIVTLEPLFLAELSGIELVDRLKLMCKIFEDENIYKISVLISTAEYNQNNMESSGFDIEGVSKAARRVRDESRDDLVVLSRILSLP